MNKYLKLTLTALAILVFQFFYYNYFTNELYYYLASNVLPSLGNDYYYLIIHHLIEFFGVFVITLILMFTTKMDFGYRLNKDCFKKSWKSLLIAFLFPLVYGLIKAINGMSMDISSQGPYLLFQFFFSGLGEEILYRSFPFALLILAYGKEEPIDEEANKNRHPLLKKVFTNRAITIILITSIFFAFAHVPFSFSKGFYGFNYESVTYALVCGVILGCVYERSKSIWIAMLAHGIINVAIIIFPCIFGLF